MLNDLFHLFLYSTLFLAVYYIIPHTYKRIYLLLASLFMFIKLSGIKSLFLLLFGVLVTYFGGYFIYKAKSERSKKIILAATLILTFGELLFLKQFVNMAIHFDLSSKILFFNTTFQNISLAVPIAISFYTLSITSYPLDIYRNQLKPDKDFFSFLLFACYFPQMSIGPVNRYNIMKEEFCKEHKFDYIRLKKAFTRILWGLFKKIIIADRLSFFINNVYTQFSTTDGSVVLLATLLFGIQLYMDFSGGIDIVLGISEAFDIKLSENFNNPYFSRTVDEYWRRWHISLHAWFRDYVFWPVLRSRFAMNMQTFLTKFLSTDVALQITLYFAYAVIWVLIGIWHCCEPRFLVSTTLVPLVSIIFSDIIVRIIKKYKISFKNKVLNAMSIIVSCITTYLLLSISWAFFVSSSIRHAVDIIKHILFNTHINVLFTQEVLKHGLNIKNIYLLIFCLAIVFIVSLLKEFKIDVREKIEQYPLAIQWAILYFLIISIAVFGVYGPVGEFGNPFSSQDFIYFKF